MTPEALSQLHALSFTDMPRPWSAGEFAGLLEATDIVLVHRPGGFALGRVIGPEAELLTLAVHPDRRRRGLGMALVRDFEDAVAARGAEVALLEVAATNEAGRALYARLGYAQAGRRPGYYRRATAPPVDALLLRKSLQA